MRFLFIFVKLTIEFRNIELFCTQFNSRVYSLIHIILSGNHKFYIQFSHLLRLQSFRITLYKTLDTRSFIDTLYRVMYKALGAKKPSISLMSSETDLSRNQAIQNQRNSFSSRISLAIQRGNAASIRGTFPDSAILSEIFVL
jgi:hypothetical protein